MPSPAPRPHPRPHRARTAPAPAPAPRPHRARTAPAPRPHPQGDETVSHSAVDARALDSLTRDPRKAEASRH
ncbi:hypothetical protein ACFU46_32200, partial [Streptomyces griseoincarnatus]